MKKNLIYEDMLKLKEKSDEFYATHNFKLTLEEIKENVKLMMQALEKINEKKSKEEK